MTKLNEGVVGGAMNLYFIYKFLRILTTPWEKTEAFELGIVDANGKILKKKARLKTIAEKEAYTMMHRLVWKLKRLMEKVPFGKTRLASYAAALWLIKEGHSFKGDDEQLQESVLDFIESDWENEARVLKEKYEGDLSKKTYNEFFTLGVSKPTKRDVQDYLDHLGNAVRLLSNNDLIRNIINHFKTIKTLKLSSNGRQVLSVEGVDDVEEVAPPGWEGTVKAMKKDKKIDNPYALAWWMKNKGMKPNIPEETDLTEEVFYWYIIKGNTQKGKVSHVGTERQLKLKIRKPIFPSGHVLMKSRKDLKIGDKWKGSYMPEGFELDEGTVLDIKDVDRWIPEIEKGVRSPWISVQKSTLGGDENVALMIKISLDPQKDWANKIYHNSRYAMIRLGSNGEMEMFASDRNLKNMRKTKFKSAKDVVGKINTWIKKVDEGTEVVGFSEFMTEGRPKLDPDYVPPRTTTDTQRATLVAIQQQRYTAKDIESIARKHKIKLDGAPVGGKGWDWDWQIAIRGGIMLGYEYGSNTMSVQGWKWDNKKIKQYIDKWEPEHSTPRDMKPMGGKILLRGFETAFDLIGEDFVSMAEELDEKWKKGTYTITDVKTGKVLGKYNSGAKAQKAADDIFQKGDYDAVAVEVDEKVVYTCGVEIKENPMIAGMAAAAAKKALEKKKKKNEEAPANNTAGVDMTPHLKVKKGRRKVETEEFGGNKVFVVSSQRWHDSRMGKTRYARYEKYVGTDSIGKAIREYGRGNPKAPIILKNSQTGAMLYLKYGGKRK